MQPFQTLTRNVARRWRMHRQAAAERQQLDLVLRRTSAHLRDDVGLDAAGEPRASPGHGAASRPDRIPETREHAAHVDLSARHEGTSASPRQLRCI